MSDNPDLPDMLFTRHLGRFGLIPSPAGAVTAREPRQPGGAGVAPTAPALCGYCAHVVSLLR